MRGAKSGEALSIDAMIVLDAHCDSPSQMYRLRDFGKDNAFAQVDFPKMKRGGVSASFFALYIPARLDGPAAYAYARELLSALKAQLDANKDSVALATSAEQVKINQSNGLISILIGLENGSALQGSAEILKEFYDEGVRYVTLTHSADNDLCDSCTGSGHWGGLSPLGRSMVKDMNRIGMLVDVAHASNDTIRDCLAVSDSPIAYTHGCCSALASSRRNLPDELLRGIAASGGVNCMSIYPSFLSDEFVKIYAESGLEEKEYIEDEWIADPSDLEKLKRWEDLQREMQRLPRPGVDCIADHICHAIDVCGVAGVGLGTDYDGIGVTAAGLEDISSFGLIFEELKRRGLDDDAVASVAGANMLRLI